MAFWPSLIAVLFSAPASACVGEVAYDRPACTCTCDPVLLFPPDGTSIPTNVVFHVEGINRPRWLRNGERLSMEYSPERETTVALNSLRDIRVAEILAPGDQVELWADDVSPSIRLGHWEVGGTADTEAPRWDGTYEVRTVDVDADACGFPEHTHHVTFDGLSDDWPPGHLFVLAEGVGANVNGKLGNERGFDVRWDACQVDDSDLYHDFTPTFQVTLYDAAGNTAGPFEVETGRSGCGCGDEGGPTKQEFEELNAPPTDYSVSSCNPAGSGGAVALLVPLSIGWLRRRAVPPCPPSRLRSRGGDPRSAGRVSRSARSRPEDASRP